ncbi:MAG: hypothetical protein Tsb005_20300 [Gammaproteobacteria bacterium]
MLSFGSGAYIPFASVPQVDRSYIEGKQLFHLGNNNFRACASCHHGNLKLRRSQLLINKDKLGQKSFFCSKHSNCQLLSQNELDTLASYLKLRYRL